MRLLRRVVGAAFAIVVALETEQHGLRTGPSFASPSTRNDYLAFYRDAVLNRLYNDFPFVMDGRKWPPSGAALSMSGVRR